ncbi:ABC transporter ATP-binding protein [Clostridium uliginosum]|uniref:Peptide/nickel transport system ATP-binding protein/oligopeptide transport system ATP-binding protein n=1 Tax=Clostridium uliginosum TaxID=119641 RepID=A0A1I1H9M3_9CLOT|nr:dipeptide ABC transporter ATP-binding protein [Clostridium uliginosum]SFC18173.1 peptide/nickel transport system ATP-binding protein/oligopeptide transport system ATP-binding protein [Clostridium uliginosum]
MDKLMEIKNLKKFFPVSSSGFFQKPQSVQAVDDVSFDIYKGETLGIVGESGCGKSTLGRLLVNLLDSTSGEILFEGKDINEIRKDNRKNISKNIQIIFQDPYASLNPRMKIGDIIKEPMKVNNIANGKELEHKVNELLRYVGLAPYHKDRYPHEFSGGQRQRVGIARAISVNPKIIVCDEAVSALDVSIQAQILNLLSDLQHKLGFTYLFIAHGLNVVKHISNRVGVMYLGKLVEIGDVDSLYSNPLHPYTKALLSAIPIPNPEVKKERIILSGDVPSPINPPSGCRFHTRCPKCMDVCKHFEPKFVELETGHKIACHLYDKNNE